MPSLRELLDHREARAAQIHDLGRVVPVGVGADQARVEHNEVLTEAECRLKRCRLLASMGQPLDDEVSACREAIARLRAPASYLDELRRITGGVTEGE